MFDMRWRIWRGQWWFRLLNCNILLVETRILVILKWLLVLQISFIFQILLFLKFMTISILRGYLSLILILSLIELRLSIFVMKIIFLFDNFSYLSESYVQRIFIIFCLFLLHIYFLWIINTSSSLKLVIILCLPPRWVNHAFIFIL